VPTLLTDAPPGELFVVRNVGNLVPPFESELDHLETPAAIEFATLGLQVEHIVVCGHSRCGAIKALYASPSPEAPHLRRWLELARGATLDRPPGPDVLRRTERRSVELQVERLMSYPSVRQAVEAGRLSLHGWHYVIEEGAVYALDFQTGDFEPIGDDDGG
jgi:carbonic anhydrase